MIEDIVWKIADWRRRQLERRVRRAAIKLMEHMGAVKAVIPLHPRDPTVTSSRGPGVITIEVTS